MSPAVAVERAPLKRCARCGVEKPPEDFHRANRGKFKRHSYCAQCFCARKRARGHGSPELRRAQNLWTRYRTTPAEVDAMLAQQGGACALCDVVLTDRFHVDHSHSSGKVRGILCHCCNVRIGGLEDPDYRARAFAYLERA